MIKTDGTTYDADWYRAILDAATDMILVKGPRSELLWANRAFLSYYGMTPAELENIIDAEHSDPDDTLQYVIDDKTVFTTGMPLDIPTEVVTAADGHSRNFHTIKSPLFNGSETIGVVAFSRAHENKALATRSVDHRTAKEYLAPLKMLTDHFPQPMLMVDGQMRVVHTSGLWRDTFGGFRQSHDAMFEGCYPKLTALTKLIEHCLQSKELAQATLTLDHKDASQQFVMELSPWDIPGNTMGGAIVTATDVTELYQKTQALQRANNNLNQFSYRASHDLKGPLSTTKGLANFIIEDIKDGALDEARKSAEKIVQSMGRLEETINKVLDLARADQHDEPIQTVHLPTLLMEISEDLAFAIDGQAVEIRSHFKVESVTLQATRFRQAIENLVSNGIKYADKTKAERFVCVRSEIQQNKLHVTVEDNGIGLPEGKEQAAFDPFTRFNSEREGTGLGLSIVKRNVEALNGTVSIQNVQGGTRAVVVLPLESGKL